jgi:hypothetical protein
VAKISKITGTATFGSNKLGEIYSVESSVGGGLSISRNKGTPYSPNAGTVSLQLFNAADGSMWGKRDTLSIAGDGWSLTRTAFCTSVSLSAQVNDAVRSTVSFQVTD